MAYFNDEQKDMIRQIKQETIELIEGYYDSLIEEDFKKASEYADYFAKIFEEIDRVSAEQNSSVSDMMHCIAEEMEDASYDDDEDDED